jgi:hypothetical protein
MRSSAGWIRVSRQSPCPICQKRDWCTLAADGSAACCMRVESDRRLGNGGWLHRLRPDLLGAATPMCSRPPPARRYLSAESVGKTWASFAVATRDDQVDGLARRLGVKAHALRTLGACWAWPHDAWGFPMFDGTEDFAGMRLRSDDGEKWALRGSRQGIFLPGMKPREETLVVEGPTDTAAAVSLGLHAIGRPSCNGGAREIATFCRRHDVKRLSVLADNDSPGIKGARVFCRQVGVRARVVVLPAKDLREWLWHGATRGAVDACLAAHGWR